MPIKAIVNITSSVVRDDEALYIFKLYSGAIVELSKFGKMPIANSASKAKILNAEDKKALNSLP